MLPSGAMLEADSTEKVSMTGGLLPPQVPGWLTTRSTPSNSSICQRLVICPATEMLAPFSRSPPASEMSTTSMIECAFSQSSENSMPAT